MGNDHKGIERQFRKVLTRFGLVHAVSLFLFILLAFDLQQRMKVQLAEQLAESYRTPLLAGDLRRVLIELQSPTQKNYSGMIWLRADGDERIEIPNNFKRNYLLESVIEIPVFFDERETSRAGVISFYFNRWTYVPLAFSAWLALLFFSMLILFREKKRLILNYETSLRLERAQSYEEIASQVAHDIRSPLSALNIVTESLVEIPAEKRDLLKATSDRINSVANDLLRKSSSPKTCYNESASIVDVISAVVREKQIENKNNHDVTVLWDPSSQIDAVVWIEATQLSRMISNLLNNAVEAVGQHGTIRIMIEQAVNSISVRISDNGRGIPSDVLSRVGRRGFSFGKNGMGSGLGLFHARKMMEQAGGSLDIVSNVGEGTTVSLIFPQMAN